MNQYFKVNFKYSEYVYCANIALAESEEDVRAHYSKYEWISVKPATDREVETAREKGMPIITCEHIEETTAEAENSTEEAKEEPTFTELPEKVTEALEARNPRSAWGRGVKAYALDLMEQFSTDAFNGCLDAGDLLDNAALLTDLLNGAESWEQYSYGGSSLIYDKDIAYRLCTKSELKRTAYGLKYPNHFENWLDTQARALRQAEWLIEDVVAEVTKA